MKDMEAGSAIHFVVFEKSNHAIVGLISVGDLKPTDLIFATRNGKPENGNNILRRHVYPACDELSMPRANWLTLRRTFSTWSHRHRVPAKDIPELMGHSEVNTQFIYVQAADEHKRAAA